MTQRALPTLREVTPAIGPRGGLRPLAKGPVEGARLEEPKGQRDVTDTQVGLAELANRQVPPKVVLDALIGLTLGLEFAP